MLNVLNIRHEKKANIRLVSDSVDMRREMENKK